MPRDPPSAPFRRALNAVLREDMPAQHDRARYAPNAPLLREQQGLHLVAQVPRAPIPEVRHPPTERSLQEKKGLLLHDQVEQVHRFVAEPDRQDDQASGAARMNREIPPDPSLLKEKDLLPVEQVPPSREIVRRAAPECA